MENRHLSLPDQKNYEYAHGQAYEVAREQLAKIGDIEQRCLKSGARCQVTNSRKLVFIEYLNQLYQITLPDIDVSLVDSEEAVPTRVKVLILHYFTRAKGSPIAGKAITYKELPEGVVYFPTFYKRTIKPILRYFGGEPHRLIDMAAKLGGHKVDYGDAAVTANAFPSVPITLVLWRGDEEFDPQGSILFDATISDYLSTEDITILCEIITWRLVSWLKEEQNP